jgi:hypothetical protein
MDVRHLSYPATFQVAWSQVPERKKKKTVDQLLLNLTHGCTIFACFRSARTDGSRERQIRQGEFWRCRMFNARLNNWDGQGSSHAASKSHSSSSIHIHRWLQTNQRVSRSRQVPHRSTSHLYFSTSWPHRFFSTFSFFIPTPTRPILQIPK